MTDDPNILEPGDNWDTGKIDPIREPSPEYLQKARAMIAEELEKRRKQNVTPLPGPTTIQTDDERRARHPGLFHLNADRGVVTIVAREEENSEVTEPEKYNPETIEDQNSISVDITSSDPVKFEKDTTVALDPNDPFEAALIDIVTMNRRKRQDYAYDGDPFSNFKETAKMMGGTWTAADSAHFNIAQKMARLAALRSNGRMNDPANESVTDTRLDLAVYAIIAYAIHQSGTGAEA